MKEIPIKLGPLALLLTVISICMTTLAILTFTTARADYNLANTYAQTVYQRYDLERQGQEFLAELNDQSLAGMEQDETGVYWTELQENGSRLKIGLRYQNGDYQIVSWRQERDWVQDNSIGGLWNGF